MATDTDDRSGALRELFAGTSMRERGPARALGIGRVLAALGQRPAVAPRLGPFELQSELGRGGMGIVYAAQDTRLRRRVAVKVLRDDLPGDDRDAILREARSMAQLSHPHVVEVFATGVDDGHAWVAMELVEGGTLAQWAKAHPVDRPDRLAVALGMVRDMGRGLAAAHARGIVHRDIKPGNVLVGEDGRVRIVDFGLARNPVEIPTTDPADPTGRVGASGDAIGSSSTRTDALVGTPRYMAPEQHERRRCTPASDQYSWGLTAWELVVGEFPFSGSSMFALYDAKARARPALPRASVVPGRVLRALARTLDPDPARRFESMRAAVDALSASPRRRGVVWVGAAAVTVGAIAWGRPAVDDARPDCDRTGPTQRLQTVWNPPRRQRVHDAVARAQVGYGPTTLAAIDHALDGFATAWVDGHVAACRARWHEGSASAEALDARTACLREQLQVVDRFVERLDGDDAGMFEHAVTAMGRLPDPAQCAESSSAELTVRSEQLSRRLAAAKAARMVGDLDGAMELAASTAEQARIEGDVAALSDALELVASVAYDKRDTTAAVAAAEEGYTLAMANDDPRRAAAHARIAAISTGYEHQADHAQRWLRHLDATQQRYTPTVYERAAAERTAAQVAWSLTDFETAEARCRRALQIAQDDDSVATHHFRVAARGLLANTLAAQGRTAEAEALSAQLLTEAEALYGDQHPNVAGHYHELAIEAVKRGQAELAGERFERAHAIFSATHGPTGQRTLSSATGVALAKRHLGQLDDAAAILEESLPHARRTPGSVSIKVLTNLAAIREDQGDPEGALSLLFEAQAMEDQTLEPNDPRRALTHSVIASTLRGMARFDEAREHAEATLSAYRDAGDRRLTVTAHVSLATIVELQGKREEALSHYRIAWETGKALEATGPDVAFAAAGTGRMLVALGRPEEAFEGLRTALSYYEASDREDAKVSVARSRGALALAHAATGDRAEGLRLAREAFPVLEADGGDDSTDLRARLRVLLGLPAAPSVDL